MRKQTFEVYVRGVWLRVERENMRTERRADRTNTGERIGERLVYKSCWNTLRAGKIMRGNRSGGASKRIRRRSQAETKYARGKIRRQTQSDERTRAWGLSTDRDFLCGTVYATGCDRSERKGDLLEGGTNVRRFFAGLRSSLANLLQERSAGIGGLWMSLPTLEASPLALWSGDGIRLPSLGRKGGGAWRT